MMGVLAAAEPELKLGISPAKTPRPQRSENNNEQFLSSPFRNLACFAPWRESSLLIASFLSNNKCLYLRGTTLVVYIVSLFHVDTGTQSSLRFCQHSCKRRRNR